MVDSMKIVVDSIESKLNEPFFAEFKEIAIEAISKYIAAIKKFEASGTKHYFFPAKTMRLKNLYVRTSANLSTK